MNLYEKTEKRKIPPLPVVRLSTIGLDLSVEEGTQHKGTLCIESENGIPVKGTLFSTHDKMTVEEETFEGHRTEIHYTFDATMASKGEDYAGDFIFITNGGEFNIPYMITIQPRSVEAGGTKISDMKTFLECYTNDREQAKEIFFHPNFADHLLKGEPEKQQIYHCLMKSRNKDQIVEEFLTATDYKNVVHFLIDEKPIVLDAGKQQEEVTITLDHAGYIEGRIYSEKGQLTLSADRFCTEDFVERTFTVCVEKNHNYAMGNDIIHIETTRQHVTIPVEWWGTLPVESSEKEKKNQIKRKQAELMHNYLYFRTGGIQFEDFAADSEQILQDLYLHTNQLIWKLYLMHIALMQEKKLEAEEYLTEIEARKKEEELSAFEEHYLLYIKSILYGTPESISEAVIAIRSYYESTDRTDLALWMLMYIDREYVYNKKLQYDTIKMLFENGCNSCLLYYEACALLNENPSFMEDTGAFEIAVFRWGVRYGYISLSLAYQFARLALRAKYYQKSIFHIALKLNEIKEDERFLQVICSLLIKGNRIGKEYHDYFKRAVEANLKIIGLNEFFIRSADFSEYEILPQRILIYFTYSNTLDSVEKAYLYANVLKNKEAYDEVFGAYYSKMVPFVEEQLIKGKINEHLAYLYTYFQEEILEKPENAKAVCDILFYQKLRCTNPNIIGAYVFCPETGQEKYYPFASGIAYIEFFNRKTKIYFVDAREQRYVKEIECYFTPFLSLHQFPAEWMERNRSNKKILLMLSADIHEGMTEKETKIAQKVITGPEYKDWMKGYALEQLLHFYSNHQKKEELATWLEKAEFETVSESFRKSLLDYYMEVGYLEEAFFGAEKCGVSMMGASKRLKLANFGIAFYEWRKDPTALALARSAFFRKKYNRDSLNYMMRYMEGELEDLCLLWTRSRKFCLDTVALECRILKQCIFTDQGSDRAFPIFSSLFQSYLAGRNEGEMDPEVQNVIGAYLEFASIKELEGLMKLTDEMHMAIGYEILSGRIKERRTKIHFLYYFAGKMSWRGQIAEAATHIIRELLAEKCYLPVYHAYEDLVSLPTFYQEFTFLTYRGRPGQNVTIYYDIEGESESGREKTLEEMMPGLYVCHMHFYHADHVNYHLEEAGEHITDTSLCTFETFPHGKDDSRFFALDHMDWEENGMETLKLYMVKSFFTDHCMKLL